MSVLTLPSSPAFSGAKPKLVDPGYTLKSAGNAASLRVDRPGAHWLAELALPAMAPDVARVFVSRLAEARSTGIRVTWPLVGQAQGSPGAPVVDGTDSAGTTLKLRGLTAGFMVKEGYWLNVLDAAGVHYLHNVRAPVRAGTDGKATLRVWPPIRCDLADGAAVKLAKPMLEGVLVSDVEWEIPVNRIFTPPPVLIEEAK